MHLSNTLRSSLFTAFATFALGSALLGSQPVSAKAADLSPAPAPPPVDDTPPPPPAPETLEPANFRPATQAVLALARPLVGATQAAPAAATAYIPVGDPYGFTAWLNGVRASYGLGAVGYDAGLSNWAAINNASGSPHGVMGSARRQNWGMGEAGTVWNMWMASPAHQAALLDPTISMIGIAASGAYWTFNAY